MQYKCNLCTEIKVYYATVKIGHKNNRQLKELYINFFSEILNFHALDTKFQANTGSALKNYHNRHQCKLNKSLLLVIHLFFKIYLFNTSIQIPLCNILIYYKSLQKIFAIGKVTNVFQAHVYMRNYSRD